MIAYYLMLYFCEFGYNILSTKSNVTYPICVCVFCILYVDAYIIVFSSWGDMLIDGPWKVEVRHWLALDDLDLTIADEASIRSLCRR